MITALGAQGWGHRDRRVRPPSLESAWGFSGNIEAEDWGWPWMGGGRLAAANWQERCVSRSACGEKGGDRLKAAGGWGTVSADCRLWQWHGRKVRPQPAQGRRKTRWEGITELRFRC